jgi:predicted dehydrogenase
MARTSSGQLKVGLVGKRACAFVAGFRSMPQTRITALCELDRALLDTLAERYAIPERYSDYEELLERGRPDIVVLGTPMHLHVPQAVAALARHIHVLSEVTAAVSLEQCRELVRAVRASRATYMMAENYCYMKANVLVKSMVEHGLFGELYYAEGEYIHNVRHLHVDAQGNPTWRTIWQVGKRGCTYGTHSLGPILQWFNERVVTVSCFGTGMRTEPKWNHDDTTLMLCQTESGGLIKIRLDMLSPRPHNMAYYALQGTKGAYEAPRAPGEAHKVWLADYCEDPNRWRSLWDFEAEFLPELWRNPPLEALHAGHGGGDYFIVRDFVQSILQGTPPPIDVYRALDFTVPGLISEESIACGGVPLLVPDFREE